MYKDVSETAILAAIRDIKNGVTYPDFWVNRYGEEDVQETAQVSSSEEEIQATAQEEKARGRSAR